MYDNAIRGFCHFVKYCKMFLYLRILVEYTKYNSLAVAVGQHILHIDICVNMQHNLSYIFMKRSCFITLYEELSHMWDSTNKVDICRSDTNRTNSKIQLTNRKTRHCLIQMATYCTKWCQVHLQNDTRSIWFLISNAKFSYGKAYT